MKKVMGGREGHNKRGSKERKGKRRKGKGETNMAKLTRFGKAEQCTQRFSLLTMVIDSLHASPLCLR